MAKKTQRRGYGDGSIYQRTVDDRWFGAALVPATDGTRRRKTVSSKHRDVVVKRLRELQKDIDGGRLATSSNTTVATYLEHWVTTVRGPSVRPKTRAWYEQAIRCHIVPQIGAQRLDKLTPEHVRQMIRNIQDEASTASAQQAHRTLATALKDAVADEIVTRNVAAIVPRPQHAAKVRREFTDDEARRILDLARQHDDQVWGVRVWLAFMTGARPGELLGLRWQYVDFDAGTIEIAWQLQEMPMKHGCGEKSRTGIPPCGKIRPGYCPQAKYDVAPGFQFEPCYRSLAFVPVKTKAGNRIVPMLPIVVALLRQMYDTDTPSHNDLVFHHADGRPYAPHDDTELWKALLGDAGLPPDAVGYQSRHTAGTLMLGADESVRMAIMGHSSVAAHRGYLHADQAKKLSALNPLTALTISEDANANQSSGATNGRSQD